MYCPMIGCNFIVGDLTSMEPDSISAEDNLATKFSIILDHLKEDHDAIVGGSPKKAKVILFKDSGKFYTEEKWSIPTIDIIIARGGTAGDSMGPFCMQYSPDFRRIGVGKVLVPSQEPWGYPFLI